jgi:hypothetical protein
MTMVFHPQSYGQSEAANHVIIMYLRCLTRDRPRQRLRWLPWAEFVFNTAYQALLQDTPFRVVYGCDPPSVRSYELGDTRVAAVAKSMEEPPCRIPSGRLGAPSTAAARGVFASPNYHQ